MAQDGKRERFSVSLSHATVGRVKEQAAAEDLPLSATLARIIDEYYTSTAVADCAKQLEGLQHKYEEAERRADTEVDALTKQLERESERATQAAGVQEAYIKELGDELQIVKTRIISLEDEVADKNDLINSLEQEKQSIRAQIEEELAAKDEDIRKLEEGVPELIKRLEEERASKVTVTTGLQHEVELLQTNMKGLEEQLVTHKGIIQGLEKDKESLQKQLELVTLRLPAPKEGFWSRVFGRRKKEPEVKT